MKALRMLAVFTLVSVSTLSWRPEPDQTAHAAPTWVEVRAPYSGTWNKNNAAPPSSHPVGIWGGDWSTDYYQTPNATGYWYPVSSGGDSVSTTVELVGNTCSAGSWTFAGIKYAFEVANGSGTLGWFEWAHVYPTGSGFSQSQSVSYGTFIGYTYNWGWSDDCYEVSNDAGVHWHIVGYHYSAYSCYAPWSQSSSLTAGSSLLGAVGANATGLGQSCW